MIFLKTILLIKSHWNRMSIGHTFLVDATTTPFFLLLLAHRNRFDRIRDI